MFSWPFNRPTAIMTFARMPPPTPCWHTEVVAQESESPDSIGPACGEGTLELFGEKDPSKASRRTEVIRVSVMVTPLRRGQDTLLSYSLTRPTAFFGSV